MKSVRIDHFRFDPADNSDSIFQLIDQFAGFRIFLSGGSGHCCPTGRCVFLHRLGR